MFFAVPLEVACPDSAFLGRMLQKFLVSLNWDDAVRGEGLSFRPLRLDDLL